MQTSLTDQDTQDLARPPVFVDPTGRRRRFVRRVALGVCALLLCYGVVLVAALLGAPLPRSALLPVPDAPAPQQQQQPVPAEPSVPNPTPTSRKPQVTQAPGAGQAEAPAVVPTQAPVPGASVTADRPNSNAASTPPGLVRHSETRNRGNGNG